MAAPQVEQEPDPISEPIPAVITLTEPVEVRDPKSSEVLKFGRGRTFRVVSSVGDAVRVRYLELEIAIPVSATDLRLATAQSP